MALVERDGELAAVRTHWARARAGRGGLVLVSAETGGGKTALVNEFARSLMAQAPVLWGACDPLATPRPLGPLVDVRDKLGKEARTAIEDAGQAHEIYVAVLEDLRARPCVLVVDDLHWADQGTVDLLRFLLRRIATTHSLVVGTLRPDEIDPSHPLRALLGDAARSPDAVSVVLPPLSTAAIRSLVESRPLDAVHVHELTGGNPFFVTQMLEHEGENLPPTVRDAILARTVDLEQDARDLLDLLVAAPEAIPDRLLPQLGIGVGPLRALNRAGLIRRSQRGVAFRHDLCRLAIAESLPPGGEAALHRRMLHALEGGAAADPAILVHHARGAQDPARVLRYATDAGVAAARTGAHSQAAEFFQLALEHVEHVEHVDPATTTTATRAGLLERLAEEQYLLDRLDEAIRSATAAIALRERAGEQAEVSADHQALATYEWYRANRDSADRHAADAVGVLRSADEPALLGHALALQAYLALQGNDLARAHELTDQARGAAAPGEDWTLDVRTRLLDSMCAVVEGRDGGRDALLGIVRASVDRFDELHSSGFSNLAYLDVEQRRYAAAAAVLEVSLPLTMEWDLPVCQVWQLGARGRLGLARGDWGRAVDDADAVLGRHSAPLSRTWAHLVRGLVTLRRTGSGRADLDAAWDLALRLDEPLRVMPAAAALVEQAWVTGRPDARVAQAVEILGRFDLPGLEWARGDLAGWLLRVDPQLATADLEVSAPHRLQLDGRHLEAAAGWAKLEAPFDQALELVASEQPDALRQGLGILDRLGADAVAARLRQDLRDRGVAGIPARARSATLSNPAGLTARELEVLALLDEGLSNSELAGRLYISPKTADHHVSSILAKLRVPDRRQAARAGRELGMLG